MNTTTTDRQQLEQFLGEEIEFSGRVVNTKAPTPEQRFVCLGRTRISKCGDEVSLGHMWIDVSHLKDLKVRLADLVTGFAYIKEYQRKNGSHSFGVTPPMQLVAA